MTFFHEIFLGIVQGITEFLPISSSAHLLLVPHVLNVEDQGLMVDVAAHAGTLIAVVLVFWRETWQMAKGCVDLALRRESADARLTWYLMIATIPGVIAGVLLMNYQEVFLRHIPIVIVSNIVWSLALWWADTRFPQTNTISNDMTWKKALFAGLMQMIALIPGTSRSGITMTAGRFLGLSRIEAARLALMMAIPITTGAVLAVLVKLINHSPSPAEWQSFGVVAAVSCLTALGAVFFLLKWLKRFSFLPFVVYRLGLALVLIAWLFWQQ